MGVDKKSGSTWAQYYYEKIVNFGLATRKTFFFKVKAARMECINYYRISVSSRCTVDFICMDSALRNKLLGYNRNLSSRVFTESSKYFKLYVKSMNDDTL